LTCGDRSHTGLPAPACRTPGELRGQRLPKADLSNHGTNTITGPLALDARLLRPAPSRPNAYRWASRSGRAASTIRCWRPRANMICRQLRAPTTVAVIWTRLRAGWTPDSRHSTHQLLLLAVSGPLEWENVFGGVFFRVTEVGSTEAPFKDRVSLCRQNLRRCKSAKAQRTNLLSSSLAE
jgi:hypothetical protein